MIGVVLHALWGRRAAASAASRRGHRWCSAAMSGRMAVSKGAIPRSARGRGDALQAGLAPHIHFTGGALPRRVGPGEQMRRLAVSLGVPEAATSAESDLRARPCRTRCSRSRSSGRWRTSPSSPVSDGYHLGGPGRHSAGRATGRSSSCRSHVRPDAPAAAGRRILREGLALVFQPRPPGALVCRRPRRGAGVATDVLLD